MSRTEPKATINPVFEEGGSSGALQYRSDCATAICQSMPMLIATTSTVHACHPSCTATATSDCLLRIVSKHTFANAGLCLIPSIKFMHQCCHGHNCICCQVYRLYTGIQITYTITTQSKPFARPVRLMLSLCTCYSSTAAMQTTTCQAAADCHNDTNSNIRKGIICLIWSQINKTQMKK